MTANENTDIPSVPDWQARSALLLGADAVTRLTRAHVLVIGLGGVGGIAAEMIARAGVGTMTIADGDVVEATNRNRQIVALTSTVGRAKADVLADRLRDINPRLNLRVVPEYLQDESMDALLASARYDCVLDAIDTVTPKVRLTLYCLQRGIPLVGCMGAGAKHDPERVRCADISKTSYCTLAKVMRKRLRDAGIERGYTVIFSDEPPDPAAVLEGIDPAVRHKRSVTGTVSYMPAVFGCHCASAVIRKIVSA